MEPATNQKRRKKIIYKFTLIFFAVILILTYFSKTINNALLPKVTTVQYTKGSLGEKFESQGIVEYKNTVNIMSVGAWTINKLNVVVNQKVKVGDILAQVDNDTITIQEKAKNLDILKLEDQLKLLNSAAEKDKVLIKETEDELALRKLEYLQIRKGLTKEGNIVAQAEGNIVAIKIAEGSTTQPGQLLFQLVKTEPEYCVTWKVSSEDATNYVIGDKIIVDLKIRKSDADKQSLSNTKDMTITTQVYSKEYSANDNSYELSANIDSNTTGLEEGMSADINISKTSSSYDCVLPLECLSEEGIKDYIYVVKERKGLLGDEMYVEKTEVTKLDSNNYQCAINIIGTPGFKDIVIKASRPLSDNMTVSMR
jgi:HlyD family secretion protein